ncbi:MAG: methylmalonyl Co-A mutase-associated GTPase MeaB [Prevotellaceae bacterium]|jgi:LAO/AO transport system kinase|nr:methylmalonyl Co-A mutase-associated GTPase MeaB [Prevotellaceae bacterium]
MIEQEIYHHPEENKEYQGLKIQRAIKYNPPVVNPYLKKTKSRPVLTVEDYVNGILSGNISVLSQAVTLVESSAKSHYFLAQQVIEKCLPHSGKSFRVGITGVPGAGKSTFIDALGMDIVNNGKKLAVLAVDPSSERSKGSILGDKTRMEMLAVSPNAFVRPSPSAGSLGGVARKTRETIILCEAAGFDVIFVETVGVGQSETAVHGMVDFFLLIQLSGTGDELQGIKRGIMEMADGIAINKADGNNIEKANIAKNQFKNALHLFPMPPSGWSPQVQTCSAIEHIDIDKVWQMIEDYNDFTKKNNYFHKKRQLQSKYWMYETIDGALKNSFYKNPEIEKLLEETENKLNNNQITPFAAANQLMELYNKCFAEKR